MLSRSIVLILVLLFLDVTYSKESCNPSCGKFGVCDEREAKNGTKESYCLCNSLYSGEDCSERWNDNDTFRILFIIYGVMEVVFMLITGIWSAVQLYITFKYSQVRGWNRWSVVTALLVLALLGSIVRFVEYIVDPHGVREIWNPIAEELMYTIPLILWLAAGFCLFLYWVELHIQTKLQEIQFVRKLRPVLYVLIILSVAIILPAGIANALVNTTISLIIYDAAFAIFFILFIILCWTFGYKLRNRMKSIYVTTKVQRYKEFLLKMTLYLYIVTGFFGAALITVVMFVILGNTQKWNYLILHTFLRIEEFGLIMTTLVLLNKKIPSRGVTSSDSAIASTTISLGRSASDGIEIGEGDKNSAPPQ